MPDVDCFPVAREWNQLVFSVAIEFHQQLGQFLQTDMFVVAEVKYLAIRIVIAGCTQESFHHVRNEIEIAPLLSTTENLDRLLFDHLTDPNSKKRLSRIFNLHSGSVSVG